MFRLRCVQPCVRRLFHGGRVNRDQVVEQLDACSVEDHVFDVVGKNRAKLTVDHVGHAVGMLWQFQKKKPENLRSFGYINSHPQFLTLQVLAENKIALMDDHMLVNMIYAFTRLKVESHHSLIQQMISEAWQRVDRLPMTCLSKFSVCLYNQLLHCSPLMGHITSIVDQRLSDINDIRIISSLMGPISSLASPRLQNALISKACDLLTMDISNCNIPRKALQFLRSTKCIHHPLLKKCNELFLHNISTLDADNICIILSLYEFFHFNSFDFKLAAKQRLTELIDSSTDPFTFCKVFVTLAPMAGPEIRERLENTAFLLADELDANSAMMVVTTLQVIQSRNLSLLNKIVSVVQGYLDVYNPTEVVRITHALCLLLYQNLDFFTKVRSVLVGFLQHCVLPHEVAMLTRGLSILPCSPVDVGVISRIEAVLAQCRLDELTTIAFSVARWVRNDPSYQHSTPSRYVRLLQMMNRCGLERLEKAEQLDLMLEELKYTSGEWFEEMLLNKTVVALQRMMDQINWTNVPQLAAFLTKMNYRCPPLMDRIASVTIEHIDKIHYSAIHNILQPFSDLNYDPVRADELYDVCIKHFTPHISSFEPQQLIHLGYSLAIADHFPEELVREIFSLDFLGKLDSQLEILPAKRNMRTRLNLMALNRAVCLECPEFQVPWFHDRFCQQLQLKRNAAFGSLQQQIHKMLGEVLGGISCLQVAVVTPYFYNIDFECKLDKHLQPLPYSNSTTLHILDREAVHWDTSSQENIRDELPPGAHRVAVDLLDSRSFCRNSHHMDGDALLRNRHLEILGYRVVQIPHYEWNSMELSTHNSWIKYLKTKLFS